MSPEHGPVFLARRTYRRRRLADGARLLPVLGGVLFCLPLLWKGGATLPGTAETMFYIFGLWAVLVVISGVISRHLRAGDADEGAAGGEEG
ncbi:hypothetical protein RA2_00773 [Roseovarius sp. A-2]|uniref:hypothetical protein n=1 Tax=Roseovarius sp. A-2 TaxID=1570360 RepID=UPI0009B5324A|nr:hypothetical protein [Roseovarius sp. A-2]GAW33730.1 hypothetical protein RA2_00773 [Roseovarius sp. A-2]